MKIQFEMDDTARSYRAHFLCYEHYNLCGVDERVGPVVLSLKTYSDLERRRMKGEEEREERGGGNGVDEEKTSENHTRVILRSVVEP
jgi:hypothetical protein